MQQPARQGEGRRARGAGLDNWPGADGEMWGQEGTLGQGMPGQGRPGPGARWAATGRRRGRGGAPSQATASAASPLPGMSEEPPRRLPSILRSAASPTALGGGHSACPGSPPSPPGASCSQPARQSSADATRARGCLSSDSRRRRLSASRQPRRRARDHTYAAIGCCTPGPGDVSAPLIGGFPSYSSREAAFGVAPGPAGVKGRDGSDVAAGWGSLRPRAPH